MRERRPPQEAPRAPRGIEAGTSALMPVGGASGACRRAGTARSVRRAPLRRPGSAPASARAGTCWSAARERSSTFSGVSPRGEHLARALEFRGAQLVVMAVQRRDRRHDVAALEPAQEMCRSGRRSSPRPAPPRLARICRLSFTICRQVVDAVQEDVVELGASGSTSRGTARSTMNTGACLRSLIARSSSALAQDRQRARRAGDDDVELRQPVGQLVQRDRVGAEARRQLLAALERPVGDGDRLRIAAPRNASRPVRSFRRRRSAAAAAPTMRREDALGQLHRGGGHRNGRAADVGLRAHVLGHRERALEQRFSTRPSAPRPPPSAPPASSGPGSAARPAPSNRARSRRGTRASPPVPAAACRRTDVSVSCGTLWKPPASARPDRGPPPWK